MTAEHTDRDVGVVTCRVCRQATEQDDIWLHFRSGRCVCARCWERLTDQTPRPPPLVVIDINMEQPDLALRKIEGHWG